MKRSPFPTLRGNDGASDEVRRPADSEDPGGAHEGAPAIWGELPRCQATKSHGNPLGKVQKAMEIH